MGTIREGLKGYVYIAIATFLIFGLVVALHFAGLLVLPSFLKLERTAYKESYQYTEAKEDELLKFITTYEDLETQKQQYIAANDSQNYSTIISQLEMQQKVIIDNIYEAADKVRDPNDLPASVRSFISRHPRTGRR